MFAFVVSLQHSRALLVPVAFLIGLLSASLGGSTRAQAADAGRPKTCLVLSGGGARVAAIRCRHRRGAAVGPPVTRATFDELPIPFRAIATDLTTGKRVVLDKGRLNAAVRASMSVPGAFAPQGHRRDSAPSGYRASRWNRWSA